MRYGVEIPKKRPLWWLPWAAAVAAAVLLMAGFAYYVGTRGVDVTVDGQKVHLERGATVATVRAEHLLKAPDGDVTGLHGGIVARGKGASPTVEINGRAVSDGDVLHSGDKVLSYVAPATVEKIVSVTEPLPAPTQYRGRGPLVTVVSNGRDGVRSVQMGAFSHVVVATKVVKPAVPSIAERRYARSTDKLIALTFDDGPWPSQTESILKILKNNGVHATFFEIGAQAHGRPYLTKELVAAGMEIGNHTYNHKILTKLPAAQVSVQMLRGQTAIAKAGGGTPVYFRPPGGAMNSNVVATAKKAHLQIVMWDIDPKDWMKPPAATIVRRVIGQARSGAIVLMHDGGGDRSQTIAALPRIIKLLKKKGYSFVTIDELYQASGK